MILTVRPLLLLLAVSYLITIAAAQSGDFETANRNQGVRLANSTLGSHAGRVEVMYHGRWGTICDIGWSSYDAAVICRMLNFTSGSSFTSRSSCAVTGAPAPFGQGTGTVWLSNLRCGYYDVHLDNCRSNTPYNINPCPHYRDAAVICQDQSVMPVPYNITMLNHTTRSIAVQWNLDFIPPNLRAIDFRFNYTADDNSFSSIRIVRQIINTTSSRVFSYTLTRLIRNTSYSLSIRADGEYPWCPYNELIGYYSDSISVSTNDTIPPSTLPMRLVSSDTRSYIGRFQVQYEGVWGNVCDDLFDMEDANLACQGLNYTEGAICYANRPFPRTTAPILLDDLNCRNAERFEDCTHRGWRSHNCGSSEAIGLVCNPGNIDTQVVTGLRAINVSPKTITVGWNTVTNIQQYRIYVSSPVSSVRSYFVSSTSTQYTIRWLVLGINYTISIAVVKNFREFSGGNCYYQNFYGDRSDPIHAVTQESPPTVAVQDFHVSILNTTSVEVTWNPPSSTIGINGVIRGYKLFVQRENMTTERIIDISVTTTRVYILNDLVENVTYSFSILMYTVGDGPRSVKLRVTVPNLGNLPLILTFGKWGDKLEARRENTYNRGFNVLCGSNTPGVTFEWRFANGSSIGITNQGFRAAHFINGTAVLQIGTASLYPRSLTRCDGGIYTCVATNAAGRTEERNFTLTIGYSQPTLLPPTMIRRGSTWIQIGWEPLDCDGGYPLESYLIQYRSSGYTYPYNYYFPFIPSFTTVDEVTGLSYTVRNLTANTYYYFRIGRRSTISSSLQYSGSTYLTTPIAGPSPPQRVEVTVGFNSEVCATWREPSLPVGTIILYNLYAEPVANSQDTYDSVDLPNSTFVKTFPGSQRSGCMRLNKTGIIYHFQMSAIAVVGGDNIEGTLSPYSPQTILYVTKPVIPTPINVTREATNTTVKLWWELPDSKLLGDSDYYNVSYSGVVEWTSPTGAYSRFLEQGWMKTRATSLTFSYLTPSTNYDFSVAVVTDIETGPRATTTIRTATETGDKLSFFQVRIQNNIGECNEWVRDIDGKIIDVKEAFQLIFQLTCSCQPRITQGEFSCRTGPSDTVVYRARVSGTPSRSANDVRAYIRDYVMTGSGSVTVGNSRYHLDASCDSYLDSIHAPDCPVAGMSTSSTTQKASSTTPSTAPPGTIVGGEGANTGQVVGIFLGAVIVGLLIALVIILAFFLYQKRKTQKLKKSDSQMDVMISEPSSTFSLSAADNKM